RKAPEQYEVEFGDRELGVGDLTRIPVSLLKCLLDKARVRDIRLKTAAIGIRERSEYTVVRRNHLHRERRKTQHLPAELGPRPPVIRHFDVVVHWTYGLRSETRIVDQNPLRRRGTVSHCECVVPRIGRAERSEAREEIARAAVPEIAVIEDGVDH